MVQWNYGCFYKCEWVTSFCMERSFLWKWRIQTNNNVGLVLVCTLAGFLALFVRPSLGERLLSCEGSRDTSGESRWRRSFDLPLSWLLASLGLTLWPSCHFKWERIFEIFYEHFKVAGGVQRKSGRPLMGRLHVPTLPPHVLVSLGKTLVLPLLLVVVKDFVPFKKVVKNYLSLRHLPFKS